MSINNCLTTNFLASWKDSYLKASACPFFMIRFVHSCGLLTVYAE